MSAPTLILDYASATDIANGIALTASTWTDVNTNQSFTVAGGVSSMLQFSAFGNVILGGATVAGISSRLVIDSAGTPINKLVGGSFEVSGSFANVLGGAFSMNGLSAGSHTVKLQVFSSGAGAFAYCRSSTNPNTEILQIQILEFV